MTNISTSNQPFKAWTNAENQVWNTLAHRQFSLAQDKLSQVFFDGFQALELSLDHIPDFWEVDRRLQTQSNWHLVKSTHEYADGQSWFTSLLRDEFLVTDYIRTANELDFTPKPDVFHDAFGHLPYIVNPQISHIIQKFSQLMVATSTPNRHGLGHIWWYSLEFGLLKENGQLRAIGAGLASSFDELTAVFSGKTELKTFTAEEVSHTPESSQRVHTKLFVLDSLDQLEAIVSNWPA